MCIRDSLRTQQIVAYESGVTQTIDPLAGSYVIEALTNQIEEGAREYIRKIDEMGGMLVAIEKGYVQQQIQDAAYEYQKAVESGDRIVVGVNRFQIEEDASERTLLKVDPAVGEMQVKKLAKLKESRDNLKVRDCLENIRRVAQGEENLMPHIIEAVRNYATEGEICGVLREVFGEYKENVVL
ncbi:MAG: methylmalonyl-CoA mutase family protein, partial [Thermanaerothrix sp.]|nr:methylmalonyl-CoA mutase family protein [Thermanaerothrix sp.]